MIALTVKVSHETWEQLSIYAVKLGMSKNDICRQLIEGWIDRKAKEETETPKTKGQHHD